MSFSPTTDRSYGVPYSQEEAPGFRTQIQDLITLNVRAMESCPERASGKEPDDQSWAYDGLGDNNEELRSICVRYNNPEAGSEQARELAQEQYDLGKTSRMYRNVLAADDKTVTCEPCLGNNHGKVQHSCTANNALISQIYDKGGEDYQSKAWTRDLEEFNKDVHDIVCIAKNVKGLDRRDQEYLNETLGKKLEYGEQLQEEIKRALSTLVGIGGSEHSTVV